jgi:hypothetical protein
MSAGEMSVAEVLAALEVAGRNPDLDLIRRCLEEREALTPAFLHWLEQAGSEDEEEWDNDDPRWYRAIHAGLLLIAYREAAALPLFGRIFRDPEQETLIEWFGEEIPAYGPVATDWAIDLAQDRTAYDYARIAATEILLYIAWHYIEEHQRIVEALRSLLPPLDADGELIIPAQYRDDVDATWTWAAYALAQLHDRGSEPQITSLYQHDLIDEFVMGGLDDYRELLTSSRAPASLERRSFDILDNYEAVARRAAKSAEMKSPTGTDAGQKPPTSIPIANLLPEPPPVYSDWEVAQPFVRSTPKVGRNEPCPCGSGKKYKQCHGKKQN